MRGKWKFQVTFVVLFLFLVPVFWLNALGTTAQHEFAAWQTDSESLVLAKIESSRIGASVESYGLMLAAPDRMGPFETVDVPALSNSVAVSSSYRAYNPQLGLMGYFYEAAHKVGFSSLNTLHLLSASLFSFALVSLTFLLAAITRRSFAVVFLLSMVASPWITFAAKNLYWSPWTWLVPICAAALFTLAERKAYRIAALAFIFVAFCIRFGSGYEFITSFILMAMSVPLLAAIFTIDHPRGALLRSMADSARILGASLLAFATVLTVHAGIRGSGILGDGFAAIWKEDVLRRTYGSASEFDPSFAEALNASPFIVLQTYLFTWNTDVLTIGVGTPFEITLGSYSLWVLIGLSAAIVLMRMRADDRLYSRDLSLIIVTAAIPLSWFILGKGHSYVHTHINYVLWYLFFIAALCFVIFDFVASRAVTKSTVERFRSLRRPEKPHRVQASRDLVV